MNTPFCRSGHVAPLASAASAGAVGVMLVALLALLAPAACAKNTESDPVPVPLAVDFPSTPTAVVTDTVHLYVFEGTQSCSDLLTRRKTGQPLPATIIEKQLAPCDLENGASIDLPIGRDVTALAVGTIGGKDFLVGCSAESAFAKTEALPISLAFASTEFTLTTLEQTTPGSTTKCAKLSDHCGGRC